MQRPKIKDTNLGPEAIIQRDLVKFLEKRGWFVIETHGNMYQNGLPDLYCTHADHKQRWVEVKNPLSYCFTPAQLEKFPKISKGAGIWILVEASEHEYRKLWQPPNWYTYL